MAQQVSHVSLAGDLSSVPGTHGGGEGLLELSMSSNMPHTLIIILE